MHIICVVSDANIKVHYIIHSFVDVRMNVCIDYKCNKSPKRDRRYAIMSQTFVLDRLCSAGVVEGTFVLCSMISIFYQSNSERSHCFTYKMLDFVVTLCDMYADSFEAFFLDWERWFPEISFSISVVNGIVNVFLVLSERVHSSPWKHYFFTHSLHWPSRICSKLYWMCWVASALFLKHVFIVCFEHHKQKCVLLSCISARGRNLCGSINVKSW